MNDPFNSQDQVDLEFAKRNFEATSHFVKETTKLVNDVQLEHKRDLIAFNDKIALYSSGVISLSITFVGFIISLDTAILAHNISILNKLVFPIKYLLFTAWGFFSISLISSLFIRLNISLQIFYSRKRSWIESQKEYSKAYLDLYKINPNSTLGDYETFEDAVEVQVKNILSYEKPLKETSFREKLFQYFVGFLNYLSILCFVAGILLLLTSIIISVNHTN